MEKLKKYYPDFAEERLTKEKLFKQVLPNGKFSDRRMNNLFSEAYLSAERFVIFQKLAEDQNLQKDLLSQSLQSRHLEDWFFKDIQKEISRLEEKPAKEWEDHLELFQLHRRMYHHPNSNPRGHSGKPTILKMDEHLDLVYLLEKATLINEKIFRNRILKNEDHEVKEEIEKWKIACAGGEHPALEFYQMRFDYTEGNRLEQYYKLRGAFLGRYEELSDKEQQVHLISLLNDTILFVKAGIIKIIEALPLYKLGIKTEILFNKGKISSNTYTTIIAISNYKRDFDFSIEFMRTYTKRLDEQKQADALFWAKAHTAYYKKDFVECLDFLIHHNFSIKHFELMSRVLTTQVYFDLHLKDNSYQSFLFNYFDSFEKWVFREKFGSKFTKKSYLRFIQICRKLAKWYLEVNIQDKQNDDVMEFERNVQAFDWLILKQKEIIKLKGRSPH